MRSFLIASAAALALLATAPGALAQTPKQGGAATVTFNNDLTSTADIGNDNRACGGHVFKNRV